jgi:hypothetical protein
MKSSISIILHLRVSGWLNQGTVGKHAEYAGHT